MTRSASAPIPRLARRRRAGGAAAMVMTLAVAACTDDSPTIGAPSTTEPPVGVTTDSVPESLQVEAGRPFAAARCEANRAAGTITYLSGFDFAATASIVEVIVAESKGYFEELCLDVELRPSFSVDNYPLIASNDAQFSSGGSFGELVDFAGRNEAEFVALAIEGRTGIDALITKPGEVDELADLDGATIGVKGSITKSVEAMLLEAGLVEGEDYETVLIDGFDPKVHMEIPGIVGFPGFKSNEPGQLTAAGIEFDLLDPADYDIPGSFGILYTNATFLAEHPTAAEDFMRAAMRGLADSLADPTSAAQTAVDLINANGNALFLSPEGEIARWNVEAGLISSSVVSAEPVGVPVEGLLEREVSTYGEIGVFDNIIPDYTTMVDLALVKSLYDDDGQVIWPS